eukprot:TRINITY_DN2167_c0_g2_i1.p1 TRINITY_DN2167_c0_g2~~TRINITY_DN2167_c0_g2_i1.p1  ORF type:complete len:415 (+),score=69.10 TRINITY_DN2167_c0_g2_i1:38-1246(+)
MTFRRRMQGTFLVGIVALLRFDAAAAASGASSECKLDPWLAETLAPGDEGFNVLCVLNVSLAQIYQGGVATASPLLVELSGDLRGRLQRALQLKTSINYQAGQRRLVWTKQPWVLFSAKGVEIPPGMEAKSIAKQFEKSQQPLVLLLFEGGAWRWPTIRVGYRRQVTPGVVLQTVARQPALFELHLDDKADTAVNALSIDLLQHAVQLAQNQLTDSMTEGRVIKDMRSSEQAFLPYGNDEKLEKLLQASAQVLRMPAEQFEELQVLRYSQGQHYDAHRDYWDPREFPDVPRFRNAEGFWHQRHATLLWYLAAPESGGETWFPRAHGGAIPYDNWTACDDRGAKLSGKNATAVLFYSLRADGDIDEYSWHCGCPVKAGTKWAANSWVRNSPMRVQRRRASTEL